MTIFLAWQKRAVRAIARLSFTGLVFAAVLVPGLAFAADKAQIFVTNENGFARLILSFPSRLDLPPYKVKMENGVLAVTFNGEIDLLLPDVAATLPDYVSVARVDPDQKGLRFGLRTTLNVNRIEAGEKLYIDLLPTSWQGLPPALPPEVVAELALRAKEAALNAERIRKAREAQEIKPVADVRIGLNPTFMRVQFNWSVATKGIFKIEGNVASVDFDWPVPVDMLDLQTSLPKEIESVENAVTPDGTRITFKVAEGVVPRFYQDNDTDFIVDVDIADGQSDNVSAAELSAGQAAKEAAQASSAQGASETGSVAETFPEAPQTELTPFVNMAGATVRLVFPFEQETPAAVFRRGDTVWLLFDTMTSIKQPARAEQLAAIARQFTVTSAGDTQVIRLDLATERLATLGSEGRAWVLSLGDILLSATEPMALNRRLDARGEYEITADLERPSRVHQFRDPDAGDVLSVVTAYPPSRGLVRDQEFVDFTALRSVQGLVIKPNNENLQITIDSKLAVIHNEDGLIVSALDQPRVFTMGDVEGTRDGFIDLVAARHDEPIILAERLKVLMERASTGEGAARDSSRLELAQVYLSNGLSEEAIGVLRVLEPQMRGKELKSQARMTLAAAQTLAARPMDALSILNAEAAANQVDGLIWRTMAKADTGDFKGARADAMAAEAVTEGYPQWIKTKFFLAGMRAAVETRDLTLASRYGSMLDIASLTPEQTSLFKLLSGRIDEADDRLGEALETYGQVIATDIRPTRAEAVYRTLLVLDKEGKIDLNKAITTLSAEALLWRGNALEADMQKLLAELYFRQGQYRMGFETVKQAVQYYPENEPINALLDKAQDVFSDLYLNGKADALEPVEALSLYYDFRNLTPPGARGDEMVRNLARRLVKVDLLTQAADLLQYQIDSRLQGVAQAQIAADLAIIQIANRNPEGALRVLNKTRMPDLSPALTRQRRVLESRAFIDVGRDELALDLISKLSGRDVELLRVDAHWKGKRYSTAAELIEKLYGPEPSSDPLSQPARMAVIRAAVGYVLADNTLGLSRIRSKFGNQMAQSAEWPMFDYVTGAITATSTEFQKVAQQVAGIDSLNAFLGAYRDLYGAAGAMTPLSASKPEGKV
jgi:tetratricopeptide (TPR) repeat protein